MPPEISPDRRRQVALVVYPGFKALEASGPLSVLGYATQHLRAAGHLGGYDITNYDNLIDDGIVIAQDYANSKMHIRLMGGDAQLPRMPISSSLDSAQIQLIRKWIGDGGVATDPFDGSPIYPGNAKND